MYTKRSLAIKTILLCCLFTFSSITNISAQKKSAAQIASEREIDNKRSEINILKSNIEAKKSEINQKQNIFDARQAAYKAEEERIEARDNAVKNRESCMSNLLADVLPAFATEVITEYTSARNGGSGNKKIEQFAFAQKMMEVLTPAYKLAHKEYLSTFVDNTDRAAFAAKADATFEQYFLGGIDRSGDTLEGLLSEHFHPKNLPLVQDVAQPMADKYIQQLIDLHYVDDKTLNMAKAMPIEFYIGWDRFVNDCGLILVHTMKDKRKKQRVPEVEKQTQLGAELRTEYLHLQELKTQLQNMESDLYISQSNLKFLEETYLKQYKRGY
jgi:hypothetical protein